MTEYPPPVPSGTPFPGMVPPPVAQSSTKNNWQGVVAAIMGLLGSPLFGVLFGVLGLRSVKARTANNRGLALTGIIAGSSWLMLLIAGVICFEILGWGRPAGSTYVGFDRLEVGDCFAKDGDAFEGEGMSDVTGLYVVDCAREHHGQVYYIGAMTETTFPGLEESSAIAEEGCLSERAIGMLDLDKGGDLPIFKLFPSSETWREGDRLYDCMVISEAEDLVGSVLLTP
jgi:hypothetical protein